MAASRLQTALDDGAFALPPEGGIAVFRPPADMDLSALPRDRVRIIHGFRPDMDRWAARGYAVADVPAPAALAVVVMPRSRKLARALVAAAASVAPRIVVDGQRDHGIDSLWREMRALTGADLPAVTRAHGRLFVTEAHPALAAWTMAAPEPGPDGCVTLPGVFSDGAADEGSALLAEALPARLPGRIADLGAGWGYLARAILTREGVTALHLVEAERLALDCARINVTDPRAVFHWADATRWQAPGSLDAVVMNPPFHTGRAADPDLGRAFIAAAARNLHREGALWLVANRHLPYEATLSETFRTVAEIGGNRRFKVLHATRPRH